MDPQDRLFGLIEQLYSAPGTTDGWYTFLNNLCTAVHGSAASFISQQLDAHEGSIVVNAQVPPEAANLYAQHWGRADPWAYSPKLPQLTHRAVVVGDELISHREMKRTAYYNEFARHFDIVRSLAGMVEVGPNSLSVVSISRSERCGPFSEREAGLLEPLVPHIRRAIQLHRRLAAAHAASDEFASVLNASRQAVLLIDAGGRVQFMNAAASRLTSMVDGLTVEHRELRAGRAADTSRLRALIATAIKTSNGHGAEPGGTLLLGRPSGRRPLIAFVCPGCRTRPPFAGADAPSAVVFVTDPDGTEVPDEGMLCALFGVTRAEAKLMRLLAQGVTLLEAGRRLGVRRETVRSRVKTIFEKTNTHRQAELVRLVLNATPPI